MASLGSSPKESLSTDQDSHSEVESPKIQKEDNRRVRFVHVSEVEGLRHPQSREDHPCKKTGKESEASQRVSKMIRGSIRKNIQEPLASQNARLHAAAHIPRRSPEVDIHDIPGVTSYLLRMQDAKQKGKQNPEQKGFFRK